MGLIALGLTLGISRASGLPQGLLLGGLAACFLALGVLLEVQRRNFAAQTGLLLRFDGRTTPVALWMGGIVVLICVLAAFGWGGTPR